MTWQTLFAHDCFQSRYRQTHAQSLRFMRPIVMKKDFGGGSLLAFNIDVPGCATVIFAITVILLILIILVIFDVLL